MTKKIDDNGLTRYYRFTDKKPKEKTMTRQDVHRVSQINPEDYDFVTVLVPVSDEARIYGISEPIGTEELIQHQNATNGKWALQTNQCHVCGAYHKTSAVWWHRDLNEYIRTGKDCAEKMETRVKGEFKKAADQESARLKKMERDQKKKAGIEALKKTYVGREALEIYRTSIVKWEEKVHRTYQTLDDVVTSILKYGKLSENQLNFLEKLISKMYCHYIPDQNIPLLKPGRQTITGTIVSLREAENYGPYPGSAKMLLQTSWGQKIWATAPRTGDLKYQEKNGELVDMHGHIRFWDMKDSVITLQMTIEATDKDPNFYIGKRPAKPILLDSPNFGEEDIEWVKQWVKWNSGEGPHPDDIEPETQLDTQPETQPVETQPVETQPVETQPVETQPVETQPKKTKKSKKSKKSSNVSKAEADAIAQLQEAIATEKLTGKAYRAIQKALTVLKKQGITKIRCNGKKSALLAEAEKILAA